MELIIKTRFKKGGTPVLTKLELDFSNVTTEQVQELASRTIAASCRLRYGKDKKAPESETIKVSEFLAGEKRRVATPDAFVAEFKKLDPSVQAYIRSHIERHESE